MLKEYMLPAGFHCPECTSETAFAVIIDTAHADAPIICNECGSEYGNVGALRLALKRDNSQSRTTKSIRSQNEAAGLRQRNSALSQFRH